MAKCSLTFLNGWTGYALSSVEGRVAMEFFDLSEAGQAKKWDFEPFVLHLFGFLCFFSLYIFWL